MLTADDGRAEGAVLVLDDVTPLIRAQRVAAWRDVARRLAHEIKNPLTPIQLSAERLRKNFANAPPNARALVDECTGAIVTEVEALKGLVDEFAQFARLRGPRTVPADLNRLIGETLQLYAGVLQHGSLRVRHAGAQGLPPVRIDPEQIRQVIINLVDNGMEALGGPNAPPRPDGQPAEVVLATSLDAPNGVVRLTVTDNGPGVPAADRDKLFMPYYSTKGRGRARAGHRAPDRGRARRRHRGRRRDAAWDGVHGGVAGGMRRLFTCRKCRKCRTLFFLKY